MLVLTSAESTTQIPGQSVVFICILAVAAVICVLLLLRDRRIGRHRGDKRQASNSDLASGGTWGAGPYDTGPGGEM